MANDETTVKTGGSQECALEHLVFDDEPLEAILYGAPSPGASRADIYAAAQNKSLLIDEAIANDDHHRSLAHIVDLLEAKKPAPIDTLFKIVVYLDQFIPEYPCPIVEEHGVVYDQILKPCFDWGYEYQNDNLINSSGTKLYRWYEGFGFYEQAADIVSALLELLPPGELSDRNALLINNLGYEFMLDQKWQDAIPYFNRSAEIYEQLGNHTEAANIHANKLLCEFGVHGGEYLVREKKLLHKLAKILNRNFDWRIRKILGLLARMYEFEGKNKYAFKYARLAVEAGKEIPSRHHLSDRAYLTKLNDRLNGE